MDFDMLITNGTIIDGTGTVGYSASVGIKDGRISAIGQLENASAVETIDAAGMAVCPGFIDPHSHVHSDIENGFYHVDNFVRQGITTCVGGNCGDSVLAIGEHLAGVDANGMKQNYAILAGYFNIRSAVLEGNHSPQPLDAMQTRRMQKYVEQAMDEGAFGVTAGYCPYFVPTDELIAFAEPAGKRGGIYASHIRSESRQLIMSIGEIIEIAQHADVAVQISHVKTCNPENWDKLDAVLWLMEDADERGLQVRADRYTYCAWQGGATNATPASAARVKNERGSWDNVYDADVVDAIREDLAAMHEQRGGADRITFLSTDRIPKPEVEGKTPAQLAEEWGCDLLEVGIRVEKTGGVGAIGTVMSEDNLEQILAHPLVAVGTDGHLEASKEVQAHPRCYGTFPRMLGKYVREAGVCSLEQAIYKTSGMMAEHFGFTDRGFIKAGLAADIVIFDPDTIADTAEFGDPHQYPVGLPHVIVNGVFAVRDGQTTDANPGRALRKNCL